ncbi:Uncharacterised protein [Mycobacteroides abscessus subsp. abscessus]|nr:Uncharacterised protein [Mycobacteroides abscessus subsp. abscessus]
MDARSEGSRPSRYNNSAAKSSASCSASMPVAPIHPVRCDSM